MSNPLISILMKQTRHLTRQQEAVSDGELLHQYVTLRDQSGFAGLVRRHGPMVWAVCRNALRTESDAEDAFQAVFLALVRSAKRIRNRDSLGAWLHGVAVRICLKSRLGNARRLVRETKVALRSNAAKPTESWHDDIVKVHEGINSLPKRERDVFVLTILEGISQTEVARQLGLQVNSVSGLLSRARKRLQVQLKTKEALSVVALTVVVSAHASVPAMLLTHTCRLAFSTSGVSLPVLALTASLTEVSMRKSLLIALLPVFLCSGIAGGTFLLSSTSAQSPQVDPPKSDNKYTYQYDRNSYNYSVPLHPAQKWEYKTIRRTAGKDNDAEMNALGEQGWELAGTNVVNDSNQIAFIFKRPKQIAEAKYPVTSDLRFGVQLDERPSKTTNNANPFKAEYAVYPLQRASADDVAKVLKSVYSTANVVCDHRTNSVHVQCEPKVVDEIKKMIQKLDGTESKDEPKVRR